MSKFFLSASLAAVALLVTSHSARADLYTIDLDTDVTAIHGTGNPSDGWVTGTSADGTTVLALQADNRSTGFVPDDSGIYDFATGLDPSSSSHALWNFAFSVNTDANGAGTTLAGLPGGDVLSLTINGASFGAFPFFADNDLGVNSTPESGGKTVAGGGSYTVDNIAQNSENILFFGGNANANEDYIIDLTEKNGDGAVLDQASIDVHVGSGTAAAPDAASTAILFGLAAVGLFLGRRTLAALRA
jgi:hypothetical protein